MWRNGVARGGGEGKNGESRGKPASMLGFEIKKNYTPQGKTLYLFSVEAMAFGGKRYRAVSYTHLLIEGGYTTNKGTVALSAAEKIEKGRIAIQALADYRKAVKDKDQVAAEQARSLLDENFAYFGYGYIKDPADLVPHVGFTFYSFRVMVLLGGYFILLFICLLYTSGNR